MQSITRGISEVTAQKKMGLLFDLCISGVTKKLVL